MMELIRFIIYVIVMIFLVIALFQGKMDWAILLVCLAILIRQK